MRTLGDRTDDPATVRASRRRAAVLRMLRVIRQQREREALELGYLDLGEVG